MSRALSKEIRTTDVDISTGELRTTSKTEFIGFVDTEDDFLKVYTSTQLCLNNLDVSLAPVIISFSRFMTYADRQHIVHTDKATRLAVAKDLGVSDERVKQLVRILRDNGIFIPIYYESEEGGKLVKKKRVGCYFVNPFVVAKGSWKDIKQLRQQIDFVEGSSSYMIEDSRGIREVKVSIPVKMPKVPTEKNGE